MAFERSIIDEYEQGGEKLRRAVIGLAADDLLAYPVPGTWSIQEIIIHLSDSDLIGAERMKRIIAEENPPLIGYNETLFTQRLFPSEQSTEDAITLFDLNRRQFAKVLRKLPDDAFARAGTHNEVGKVTLGDQLRKYCQHLDHHLRFVMQKRAKLGKALSD